MAWPMLPRFWPKLLCGPNKPPIICCCCGDAGIVGCCIAAVAACICATCCGVGMVDWDGAPNWPNAHPPILLGSAMVYGPLFLLIIRCQPSFYPIGTFADNN